MASAPNAAMSPAHEAAKRTRDCLSFYWDAPQGPAEHGTTGHKGFFYHFLKYDDGTRHATTELSTVDTTLFLGGALFAQSYFDRNDPVEAEIRELAEKIYTRVEWDWAQRNTTGTQAINLKNSHGIVMGWKPESGWGRADWVGYNEGMLVYVLALGIPYPSGGQGRMGQGLGSKDGRGLGHVLRLRTPSVRAAVRPSIQSCLDRFSRYPG